MENIKLPESPELLSLRMILDIQNNHRDPVAEKYFLANYTLYERVGRMAVYEELAKIPFQELFVDIKGYNKLSKTGKECFLNTIYPFLQAQNKSRLVNTFIHHIENRSEPNGIRVYLMEHGHKGFQYFTHDGNWG